MSVTIEPTIFKNSQNGSESFGFRIYDEYAKFYENAWDKTPPDNDMAVLEKVLESDDPDIKEMLKFVKENKDGLNIGDQWYDWGEIKGYFS